MKNYIFIIYVSPLLYLCAKLFIIKNVNDPIKYIYTITGVSATLILLLLLIIPLIKDKINLMKYRKSVGIIGFIYALLHFLNFIFLDSQFDIEFIIKEVFDKSFIYLGIISFFILLFMLLTSIKKLYKKYNKYHKLIYFSILLITIHWVMAQKSLTLEHFFYLLIIFLIFYYKLKNLRFR